VSLQDGLKQDALIDVYKSEPIDVYQLEPKPNIAENSQLMHGLSLICVVSAISLGILVD